MKTIYYVLMCNLHRLAKRLLGRQRTPKDYMFVDVSSSDISQDGTVNIVRDTPRQAAPRNVALDELYPVENVVQIGSNKHLRMSFIVQGSTAPRGSRHFPDFSQKVWRDFVDNADIPEGYRNAGLKYGGYIASGRDSWCLPSWIWTNAAVVRYLCFAGELATAQKVGEILLAKQEPEGGWIVRSDYSAAGEIPVMAPNDSAYIANNALLSLYKVTGDKRYLEAAHRCAAWIIESVRDDGLVWTGFDVEKRVWIKDFTIVDTGFTAGLFAELFMISGDQRYGTFLERFVDQFIELFFDPQKNAFATSVDKRNRKVGGLFSRGQAWALEGLIPAYQALKSDKIKGYINRTVETLLRYQLSNGGWSYVLDRPYFGEDCKGVPVLAKSLLDWNDLVENGALPLAAGNALEWCKSHTKQSGDAMGGIFSYNLEGAVVHNLYTETAFVYASSYALEVLGMIEADG